MTRARRQAQSGAAAVEFALCLPIFMVLAWGLLSFGALFYTQLAVSRAAHDGANAIAMLPEGQSAAGSLPQVRSLVQASLASTPIVPGVSGFEGRRQWLIARQDLVITVNDTSTECDSPCVTLRIEYPYGNDVRLLPNIGVPGLGMLSFIPDRLVAKAVVAR